MFGRFVSQRGSELASRLGFRSTGMIAMPPIHLNRRRFVGRMTSGLMTAAAAPRIAHAATKKAVTAVLESEVVILDPHQTTAAISRTFGYHVFDTLFSMNAAGAIQPQMVDRYAVSPDELTWEFVLRPGLTFHDGAPVTAEDCIASLRRWAPLDAMGRMLTEATADLKPPLIFR